jgi:rhodanese-related sulfurtransferase
MRLMSLPRELGVLELRAWLTDEARAPPVLLDVRNHDEWAWARLAGATFIPLGELEERHDELLALKTRPIVVYCHHGVRSLYGAEFLAQLGYQTTSLRGGLDAWSLHVDPTLPRY